MWLVASVCSALALSCRAYQVRPVPQHVDKYDVYVQLPSSDGRLLADYDAVTGSWTATSRVADREGPIIAIAQGHRIRFISTASSLDTRRVSGEYRDILLGILRQQRLSLTRSLALWCGLPAVGLYLLGIGLAWALRGFEEETGGY